MNDNLNWEEILNTDPGYVDYLIKASSKDLEQLEYEKSMQQFSNWENEHYENLSKGELA